MKHFIIVVLLLIVNGVFCQDFHLLPSCEHNEQQSMKGPIFANKDGSLLLGVSYNPKLCDTNSPYFYYIVKYSKEGVIQQKSLSLEYHASDSSYTHITDLEEWNDTLYACGIRVSSLGIGYEALLSRFVVPFDRIQLKADWSKEVKTTIGRERNSGGRGIRLESYHQITKGYKLFTHNSLTIWYPQYNRWISSDAIVQYDFNKKIFYQRIDTYNSNNLIRFSPSRFVNTIYDDTSISCSFFSRDKLGQQIGFGYRYKINLDFIDTMVPIYKQNLFYRPDAYPTWNGIGPNQNIFLSHSEIHFPQPIGSTRDTQALFAYALDHDTVRFVKMIRRYKNIDSALKEFSGYPIANFIQASDSSYYMCRLTNTFGPQIAPFTVMKLDKNLNYLWTRKYLRGYGGHTIAGYGVRDYPARKGVADPDGGMAMLTTAMDSVFHYYPYLLWLDKDGNPRSLKGIDSAQDTCTKPVGIASAVSPSILIYPNPAQDRVQIEYSGRSLIKSVSISDINGRVIGERPTHLGSFSTADLSNGVYYLQIKNDEIDLDYKIEIRR